MGNIRKQGSPALVISKCFVWPSLLSCFHASQKETMINMLIIWTRELGKKKTKTKNTRESSWVSDGCRPHSEKFEDGDFSLNTHQMFSVHTTPTKFKNATIIGHFEFTFRKTRQANHVIILTSLFPKSSVCKIFSVLTPKRNTSVFQIPPV